MPNIWKKKSGKSLQIVKKKKIQNVEKKQKKTLKISECRGN